ncbi:hypothetical protein IFM89_016582 [Coptis chinensis]|uniref:Uncharacterized protein n=1 Tax=Coptis chinensis TaxID=261450 RepID=A0A835I1D8_9MAGN|nr:hypothetical protein IFM89_016582 [Coptis chinensis]
MKTQKDVVTQPNVDINGARVRKKNRTNTESSIRSDIGAQGSFDLQTRPQAVIWAPCLYSIFPLVLQVNEKVGLPDDADGERSGLQIAMCF